MLNQADRRSREFTALRVTSEEQELLDTWTVSRLVSLRTRFGPLEMPEERSERSEESQEETVDFLLGPALEPHSAPSVVAQTVSAAREVIDIARTDGRAARLTPELLGRLNGTGFRTEDDRESPAPEALAAHLRSVVDHACQWFDAESFAELNPLEQAAIVLLRLLAIRPFAERNEETAFLAAGLFTLRAGLPALIVKPDISEDLAAALEAAEQMNTQPAVDLVASAVATTLEEMIDLVKGMRAQKKHEP